MNYRKCEEDDWNDVLALLAACELPTSDLAAASCANFLVCECGGEIVGTAALESHGDGALVRSVAVRHDVRGKGIATAMLDRLEAAVLPNASLYLLTTTATPYFERRGWQVTDRASAPASLQATAEFSELCPSSSTCMMKSIRR